MARQDRELEYNCDAVTEKAEYWANSTRRMDSRSCPTQGPKKHNKLKFYYTNVTNKLFL